MDQSVNKITVSARIIRAVTGVARKSDWNCGHRRLQFWKWASLSKMFLQRNTLPHRLATTGIFPERMVLLICVLPILGLIFTWQNINASKRTWFKPALSHAGQAQCCARFSLALTCMALPNIWTPRKPKYNKGGSCWKELWNSMLAFLLIDL